MNKKYLLGGGIVGVVILAVAVWFLFLKGDAPDEATNLAANNDLDQVLAEETPADDVPEVATAPTVPADGINGVWTVDAEIGNFDFETASGSFAGFRVEEELVTGDTTAVGRSGGVTGSVTIEGDQLSGAEITVDMTSILSNDGRRENAIRSAIGASDFPTSTFTFDGGLDLSGLEVGGATQTFSIEGNLTVAGVTNPVTFSIDANVRDDGFGVIVGSTEIVWQDFGITPPSASIVVSVADEGIVEFQLIVGR